MLAPVISSSMAGAEYESPGDLDGHQLSLGKWLVHFRVIKWNEMVPGQQQRLGEACLWVNEESCNMVAKQDQVSTCDESESPSDQLIHQHVMDMQASLRLQQLIIKFQADFAAAPSALISDYMRQAVCSLRVSFHSPGFLK